MGSSMGGGTGLWYAALHPEDVAAGLYIAPALDLERSLLAWAGPEQARLWEETGSVHFADGDHRLLDRKERLWELMLEFLRGREIV
jgi:pimeloyl-ACP methyl ester carboxylesterase